MEKVIKWLNSNFGEGNCGYGSGSGDGDGDGKGSGFESGYGSGYGYGYGSGYGIKSFNSQPVYILDNIPTLISHVSGMLAKGFILNEDLTLTPCYVAKGNGLLAHGETAKEAAGALQEKLLELMDSDVAIDKFMEEFEAGKKYSGNIFFKWHHYLTGSCEMGRKSFVKNQDINLDNEITVEEFIAYCENDYGSEIIRELKKRWKQKVN